MALVEDVEAIFVNIDWDKKGQTLKDFQQLKLESTKLMNKGLVFVWAPKEYISELLTIMEKKDFVYVENLEIVKLDIRKAKAKADAVTKTKTEEGNFKINEEIQDIWSIVKCLNDVNPCDLISQ